VAYIYKHIRKDKSEPFYIGIGSDKTYYRAHRMDGRNNLWKKIASKTEIEVVIVKDNITWDEACEGEKNLIKEYGRINNKTGILANLTEGGEGTIGKLLSDETRFLLGKGNRGKKRTDESKHKQSISTKGIKKSEEHKEKIRMFRLGKKWDDETKKKISQNKKGNQPWNKGLSLSVESKIKMSLAKKGKNTKGENSNAKKVLNIDNGFVFETLKEAAESIGMNYSTFKEKIKNNKINFKYIKND